MRAVPHFFRLATALSFAAAAAAAALVPARARNTAARQASAVACSAPADLVRLVNPLKRVAQRIAGGQPLTIVAIGSSSTAGAGASSPAMSYPSRLEVELKALFPRADITVVNRGVNGEESRDMLARFDRDVISPTSRSGAVAGRQQFRAARSSAGRRPIRSLRDGLKRLREAGTDVVLINPQYAPKVITKHDVDGMVDLIHAHGEGNQRRSVRAVCRDALLAADRRHSVQHVHLAGRAAHERLELRLHRQAAGRRDP